MALNPEFVDAKPVMSEEYDEKIITQNGNVDYEIRFDANNTASPSANGSGKLFLTNFRIVLYNNEQGNLKGFQVKNYKVYDEKLE